MSLPKLRIDIEREVRTRLDMQSVREPLSLGPPLSGLAFQDDVPAGSKASRDALQIMNKAAHAMDTPRPKPTTPSPSHAVPGRFEGALNPTGRRGRAPAPCRNHGFENLCPNRLTGWGENQTRV